MLSLVLLMIPATVPICVTSLGPDWEVGQIFLVPGFGLWPMLIHHRDPNLGTLYLLLTTGVVRWWFGLPPTPSLLGTHLGKSSISARPHGVYMHVPIHPTLSGNNLFGIGTYNWYSVIL